MLSSKAKLAKKLQKTRLKKGLSQARVAELAGFTQPYLAQVESGYRPVSATALAKLEGIYGVKFDKYKAGVGRRGRPAHWAATRSALREVGRAVQAFVGHQEPRKPSHPQPHQVRRVSDPLWPMALHLGLAAREEVERLELARAHDEWFWRQFNSLRFDSWSEKRLLVRASLLGGQWLGLRLKDLGCSLDIVDGLTGEAPGIHRACVMKGQSASVVWAPQVAVRGRSGIYYVDNLLLISSGKKRITVVVEVNGKQFHQDLARQRRRDRELGVPVLHIDAGRLGDPGLIREILSWAHHQLQATA